MATRTSWAADLLARLGFPVSHGNLVGLVAWEIAEGGWFDNPDTYNPLNTTLAEPGSHPTNSAGVQAFATYDEGMWATIATLRNGLYGPILDALQRDAGPGTIVAHVAASPWGTGPISAELVGQADVEVTSEQPQQQEDIVTPQDIDAIADAVLAKVAPAIEDQVDNHANQLYNALVSRDDGEVSLRSLRGQLDALLNTETAEGVSTPVDKPSAPVAQVPPPPPPPPPPVG